MDDIVDPALSHDTLIHDFNNVFETITDAAELLNSDKRWKPLAATLIRSVARGKRLLGAIPDRTPMLKAIVDDVTQSTLDYCTASRRPRMRVVHELSSTICLPGSTKNWERVFANLFLNSVQMMQKPGRINVAARENDGRLVISISDNGPGIPEEVLGRMFQPNVSTKRSGSRSGLGLHIVSTIVNKYGGTIAAANNERRGGAIFTIDLPALR